MTVSQPVVPPRSADEFVDLVEKALLVDLAGRPLVLRPCVHCGRSTLGETCPASLRCPTCGSESARCVRPSGHECAWHAERIAAAELVDGAREESGDPDLPAPWPQTGQMRLLG